LPFSLCHLFLVNWRAFLSYLKGKAAQGIRSPVELATVIILSCFFGLGTYYGMQPFSAITAFGDRISGSWENRGRQAPVPHAELMTLDELSRQPGLGVDAAVLLEKLRKAGLKVGSQQETLARIAEKNGMTAEKVYEIIAPEGKHEKSLGGAGFGRRTIRQIADDAGVSAASLQLALRQKGIDAQIDTPLRDVAADNHMGTSKN
jgi:DNA-binding phage protein